MMLLFALLMAMLIFLRLILPLRIRIGWKVLLAVPILAVCCKHQLVHHFGGPMFFAPDLPAWILLTAAWAYASALLLFGLLILKDVIFLIVKIVLLFRKSGEPAGPKPGRRIGNVINLILVGVAVLLAAVGIFRGTSLPSVRELTLSFPNLPPEADGFRIAVLADLHADRVTRAPRIRQIVERANALRPDLTVLLGDFVDGTVERCGGELIPLRELQARQGVYAVPGNHEYYSGYAPWMKFFSGLGLRMLENSCVRLSGGIWLAGVTDPAAGRTGEVMPDLQKTLHGIPVGEFILLLAHRPAQAAEASRNGVSLQLSGHTHGGMIFGIDWVVASFNQGFVSGLYEVNGMKLYVSNGTGIWNGFPVRLGRESEITLITLHRGGIDR